MKKIITVLTLLLFLACDKTPQTIAQVKATPAPSPTLEINNSDDDVLPKSDRKSADDFVTEAEKLSYGGYDIFKEKKTVVEDGIKSDIQTVVIQKRNKMIARYMGMDDPHSGIDFGFFSFLGTAQKQLIVSASRFRGGRQWLAELTPTYREIFNTEDWGVGREGADLGFIDLDKDGVYEITTGDFWYYAFSEISMSETPVVSVIFAYDKRAGKYVPANHRFKEYSLKGLDEEIKSLPPNEGYEYLGKRVDVLLSYLYAGEEKEGWAFFERSYQAKDKARVKRVVKDGLKNSKFYRYIKAHSQK
jgi:hypothetical protein